MLVVVEVENEVCNSKMYTIWIQKVVASMKKSVRPVFRLLLVFVIAATFICRVVIQNGVGSGFGSGSIYGKDHIWGSGSGPLLLKDDPPLDFALFNSTLIKLAEVDDGEVKLKQEIKQLLVDDLVNSPKFRTFASWRRFFSSSDLRVRTSKGMLVNRGSPGLSRVRSEFRMALSDWSRKKRFQPDVLDELVEDVKVPIDRYNGGDGVTMDVNTSKYSSCAVVGNSGILLTKEFGKLIDDHELVIRLNNARIDSYKKNVGSKTGISFVNSNILHLCARREDCFCHPYGANVPIVMYMCQPAQFLDYVVCDSSHKAPLIVTDPKFDVLCARIVKYYSLKRFADGSKNKTMEEWNSAHEGSYFHYSSGMQAVMLALGICDEVNLFGFGKSTIAKHHYHTNQKSELALHDYMSEYDFYRDLIEKPRAIPFISRGFKFPPVKIYQ